MSGARSKGPCEIVVLPNGISMNVLGNAAYDWDSIKALAEKGVPFKAIAKHFKGLNKSVISDKSLQEQWMTPTRTRRMRNELATKQRRALHRTGEVRDAGEVMKEIWIERQADLDEKAYGITRKALNNVADDVAKNLITDARDLKTIVDVGRIATGAVARDAKEADAGPSMAINVGFLRSAGAGNDIEIIDI